LRVLDMAAPELPLSDQLGILYLFIYVP